MSITPLTFTGVSSFSDDFQTIVNRAVAIAGLPVTQLQNRQADILSQKTQAGILRSAVADLAGAVKALGQLGSTGGLSGSSSNSSAVSVTSVTGGSASTYTLTNITSVASFAAVTSEAGYADTDTAAVSSTGTMKLVVGGQTQTITLGAGENNLEGLRDAINSAGLGVTASILTTGTGETPNYLSITADDTGSTRIQVIDDPTGAATQFLETNTDLRYKYGTVGTAATADTAATYATADSTAVSSTGTVRLVVGSQTVDLDVSAANNLNGLRDAINGAGLGVTAAVTGEAGSYALTLTNGTMGQTALQLIDDPTGAATQLLETSDLEYTYGSNTEFDLNGIHVTKTTTQISDVIEGLSFEVRSMATSVTLTTSVDRSQMESALEDLADAYNTVHSLLLAQSGSNAGLLSGNNMLQVTQRAMRSLTASIGSGDIASLSELGIDISTSGEMSLDSDRFDALSAASIKAGYELFGSSTTGLGALESDFTQISDPINGLIESQIDIWDAADERISDQVDTITERINGMQATLTAKLQAADTLLATLEAQENLLTSAIDGLNFTTFGKNKE